MNCADETNATDLTVLNENISIGTVILGDGLKLPMNILKSWQ